MNYPQERTEAFERYYRQGFPSIFTQSHADALDNLLRLDRMLWEFGADGGVSEIGVLDGGFFIAMHNLMLRGCISLAIDVFDLADYQLDPAGIGFGRAQLPRFRANLAAWAIRPWAVVLVEQDSMTITPMQRVELLHTIGFVKFFSIDGNHTEAQTWNDLEIAGALTAIDGIIIVDDYPNGAWPGVKTATSRWLIEHEWMPLLEDTNKLYLAHRTMHEAYKAALGR